MANKVEGNVVEEYKNGQSTIRICDDYCRDKTPEDVDKILEKIAEDAVRYFSRVGTA